MKAILRKDGCLAAITERPVNFTDDNKWIEMDGNAMANFHLALADEVLSSIEEKKTTKEIWDHLTKLIYFSDGALKYTKHLIFSAYILKGEQECAKLLLQSLPDSYDQLIINLTNSNVTSLVFDDVAAAVLQEENRRKNKEDKQVNLQQAEALTTMRGRSTERGQSSSHKHGNTANTSDDGDALCCEASTTVEGRKKYADIWLIDSGAIYHMTSRREWFHHYELVSGGSVYSCNDHALEIVGVGTIKLNIYDGTIKVVFRGALVVLKGQKMAANLYMLKGETLLEAEASVASCSSNSVMLWHQKLGHMSEQGMKILVEQNLLPGLTKVTLPLCDHCITSKQHRLKFNKPNSRGKSVLELVHSDVWQAPVTSLGGAKYFVSFIDDYSRRCWVYPIKPRKSFWAEVVNTACYLVNRAPSTTIELKTPMEMWTGKPADYSNLHVFGSIVYVMYNSQEISKMDPKSRKYKLLGYADGVKGYRLWDSTARKVIISMDEIEQEDSSEAEPTHDEQEPESSEAPTTRQSYRVRRRPNWHSDYVIEGNIAYCLLTKNNEPSTYQEAINSSDASLWMMAMQEEIEALHKNNTWDLVPLPQGRKPIGNKWVFKIKRNGDDQVERYRARLVVKGYAQKEDQLDVKTAFLHGNLEEEIYMLQPEGFEEKEKKNLVCRLNKSLYGLKQAPRCWYKRFDSFIMCLGYNRLNADPCAYFKSMQDCKPISTPLPINFKLSSSMSPSSEEERMKMSRVPYASTVGSLMFAMICTRPDIAQAVGVVSRYMANPGKEHWNIVKRILRYIKGTSNIALCYRGSNLLINGYVDSDYAGDFDKSKSTTGYVFKIAGGAVSWVSKLQSVVAISTTEAEYVSATQASKEAIWLKMLLEELGHNQEDVPEDATMSPVSVTRLTKMARLREVIVVVIAKLGVAGITARTRQLLLFRWWGSVVNGLC
ncbi:hypothetical protein F3Y22_tig00111372pilonHSYRG00031 [Hibiscus syriacus]|uniref:Uncharacterized protein n=1 Tax=Hibiscus syriacus TaxID=106335 RepID=A0A6A2YMV2_HIBSY|nr:hypothetical protein F3Y22_tig00111372pilonHSYRG00031 [Hibiscus syriacus]